MKKKTLFGLLLSSTLILAGVGSYIGINAYNQYVEELNEEDIETEIIKGHGMTLKKLNTTNNSDGSVTKTFSYTILPSDATNKSVNIGFYTSNSYSNSNYITYSVNSSTQKISVTCKKAFGEQIKLRVQSTDNSSVYSYITLDYEKKITNTKVGQYQGCYVAFGIQDDGVSDYLIQSLDHENLFVVNYSNYSLDKNYTYSVEISEWAVEENDLSNYPYNQSDMIDKFANLIINAVVNESSVTDTQLKSMYQSTAFYQWLSGYYTNGGYLYYEMYYSIKCNETNSYILTDVVFYPGISFKGRSFTS